VSLNQFSLFEKPERIEDPSPDEESAPIERAPDVASTGDPLPAPGSSPESALTVAQVNAAARRVVETSFPPMWITGEVSNWNRSTRGHRYFSLRDPGGAQLSCVMWRSNAERLPIDPDDGMEVSVFGQLTIYEGGGRYQLSVETLQAFGEGLWQLAFEKLKRQLAAEGLLDPSRKRALPRVPLRIGVVTSRTGAALRDLASVVRRRAPWTHILLSDCRVQGEGAAEEIVRALDRLVREGSSEVIVLTRGGGSIEDLWAFNEEAVARAIASSPIPIVSAIGHEIDFTIADLVADYRAPTPSAAGEAVVPERAALVAGLQSLGAALAAGLRDRTRRGRDRLEQIGKRLTDLAERSLEIRQARRDALGGRLQALSPLGILQRGYAVPLNADGRVMRRVEQFETGERFRLRLADGEIGAVTQSTQTSGEEVERRASNPGD